MKKSLQSISSRLDPEALESFIGTVEPDKVSPETQKRLQERVIGKNTGTKLTKEDGKRTYAVQNRRRFAVALAAALLVISLLAGTLTAALVKKSSDVKTYPGTDTSVKTPVSVDDFDALLSLGMLDNLWTRGDLNIRSVVYGEKLSASAYKTGEESGYRISTDKVNIPNGQTVNLQSVVGDRYAIYKNKQNEVVIYDTAKGTEVNLLSKLMGDKFMPYEDFESIALGYAEEHYPEMLETKHNIELFKSYCAYRYNRSLTGRNSFPKDIYPDVNEKLLYTAIGKMYPFPSQYREEFFKLIYSKYRDNYEKALENGEAFGYSDLYPAVLADFEEAHPGMLYTVNNRDIFEQACLYAALQIEQQYYELDFDDETAKIFGIYGYKDLNEDDIDYQSEQKRIVERAAQGAYDRALQLCTVETEEGYVETVFPEYDAFLELAKNNIYKDYSCLLDDPKNLTYFEMEVRGEYIKIKYGAYFSRISNPVDPDIEGCREQFYRLKLHEEMKDVITNYEEYLKSIARQGFLSYLTLECVGEAFRELGGDPNNLCAPFSVIVWAFDEKSGMCVADLVNYTGGYADQTLLYDLKNDRVIDVTSENRHLTHGAVIKSSADGSCALLTYAPNEHDDWFTLGSDALYPNYDAQFSFVYAGERVEVIYTDGREPYALNNVNFTGEGKNLDNFPNAWEGDRGACSEGFFSPEEKVIYYKVIPDEAFPKGITVNGSLWYYRLSLHNSERDKWAFYTVNNGVPTKDSHIELVGNFVRFVGNESAVVMEREGKYHICSLETGEDITGSYLERAGIMAHELVTVYQDEGKLMRKLITGDAAAEEITEADVYLITPDGAFAFVYRKGNGFIECWNVVTLEKVEIELDKQFLSQLSGNAGSVLKMDYNALSNTLTLSFYLRKDVSLKYRTENFVKLLENLPCYLNYFRNEKGLTFDTMFIDNILTWKNDEEHLRRFEFDHYIKYGPELFAKNGGN